ncbi:hypothetical protein [Isoptericola variabilis]|uniref:Lipoprotein n=1 Tax=Isoptericola variabilis (strain 225) TaxID=743718 RepID=F6FVS5_ISOV2|nr:hypothetical protein [Isoptericola variabilis]AEG45576.1 hypothetical protein Isova_2891 [Isoptericola variabilis 225]TWH25816.1 hypothetical protein L600_000900000660 [Isoptericola variabilis J7]
MRKHLAAIAALSVVLLGACAGPDQPGAATSPSASASVPEAPTESGPEPISTVQTCAGYYDGGEYSVDHRVTTWGPELGGLDEEGGVQVTVVRDRLQSLLLYANDETTPALAAIQVPFQNALSNGAGNPEQVAEAAAAFRTLCEDAGYEFTR